MFRNLFIKIFAITFLITFILPTKTSLASTNPTLSSTSHTYKKLSVPVRLVANKMDSPPVKLSLIKTAISKKTAESSYSSLSFETKDKDYFLDVTIVDKDKERAVKSFYRFFNEKTKSYINQIQFEHKAENFLKLKILTNNPTKQSFAIMLEFDWQKAKELSPISLKLATNLASNEKTINKIKPENKSIIVKNNKIPELVETTFYKNFSNPAKMQDYINYYNSLQSRLNKPTLLKSIMQNRKEDMDADPEDVLEEDFNENSKKEDKPILRSLSDFFSTDTITRSEGTYLIDISSTHLNPLAGKLADENSKDTEIIKKLSQAIIAPNLENEENLKEIFRQELDDNNKRWAKAKLERKNGKLYATVRLHLIKHISRSQEDGPFFKILEENGDYNLISAIESHLTDSYADYSFEVPRENFSALLQLNVKTLNKSLNFYLEVNPRTIKKGNFAESETQIKDASPLTKTIILALVLLILIAIPSLLIKRKRYLDNYEDEEYDDYD
ncbi:hypothetical protein IR073_03695 [Gemella sp. 19428wG2_WT2a]|nr:hypothetical protein [Gemella sp. 19428wG2_WT2a]TFU59475.1 hypothetical protein E4T67_03665 [Gemella sp. WT2a]